MISMAQGKRVAVVGVTGAVGQEFLSLFLKRRFPVKELVALASPRSTGQTFVWNETECVVQELRPESFEGVDLAFFSAGASRSSEFAPEALKRGAVVIDNSSAFRLEEHVPLIVPEVNGDVLTEHDKLVANPNCTAAILLMAVAPLRQLGEIDRLVVSTYQSASGAGAQAMEELREQTLDVLEGRPVTPKIMPHPYAFNLFSHNTSINEHGYNDEEWKVIAESRKMLGMPDLKIGVTCVRVPVMRAHSLSVTVEFNDSAPELEAVREVLGSAPGVRLVDDRERNHFPMPLEASGGEDVLVGRIRRDVSHDRALSLFIAGDQLLKGAAQNAVQIAEWMIERDWV